MRKNSQSLIIRSFLAIFVASIFLIASCDWGSSENKATEDSQSVIETSDDDAQQQRSVDDASEQQEINYESSDIETMESKSGENIQDDDIFTIVDKMPEYPGGEEALLQYLSDNIEYPVLASEQDIQGTVYVSFLIRPNGSVDKVKVIKGIGGGCDEEAVRVVKAMPKWTPGYEKGVAVKVEHHLPINFSLH